MARIEAEHLIEPVQLRPQNSMPPRRGEEMTGTRITGHARQHRLALEKTAPRLTLTAGQATNESLSGLDNPLS